MMYWAISPCGHVRLVIETPTKPDSPLTYPNGNRLRVCRNLAIGFACGELVVWRAFAADLPRNTEECLLRLKWMLDRSGIVDDGYSGHAVSVLMPLCPAAYCLEHTALVGGMSSKVKGCFHFWIIDTSSFSMLYCLLLLYIWPRTGSRRPSPEEGSSGYSGWCSICVTNGSQSLRQSSQTVEPATTVMICAVVSPLMVGALCCCRWCCGEGAASCGGGGDSEDRRRQRRPMSAGKQKGDLLLS